MKKALLLALFLLMALGCTKKPDVRREYYPNGNKKSEAVYKNDKRHGKYTVWHANGQKIEEGEFKDGKLHGKYTVWYANGQKIEEGEFKDGKLHGKYTRLHKNGRISEEGEFKDGKLHGKYTVWHESGTKASEGEYRDHRRYGIWTWWDLNGQKKTGKTLRAPFPLAKGLAAEHPVEKDDPLSIWVGLHSISIAPSYQNYTIALSKYPERVFFQFLRHKGKVVELKDGGIPSRFLKNGDKSYFLIPALQKKLREVAKKDEEALQKKQKVFNGEYTLYVHPKVPFLTVARIIYTAGKSRFRSPKVALTQNNGSVIQVPIFLRKPDDRKYYPLLPDTIGAELQLLMGTNEFVLFANPVPIEDLTSTLKKPRTKRDAGLPEELATGGRTEEGLSRNYHTRVQIGDEKCITKRIQDTQWDFSDLKSAVQEICRLNLSVSASNLSRRTPKPVVQKVRIKLGFDVLWQDIASALVATKSPNGCGVSFEFEVLGPRVSLSESCYEAVSPSKVIEHFNEKAAKVKPTKENP